MREFRINSTDTIIGRTEKTRNGFRHVVEYLRDGRGIESRSVSYLNRTWETYEYESAISALLDKMIKNHILNPMDKSRIMEIAANRARR